MDITHSDDESTDNEDYAQLNAEQNRKKKKAGGWQSLGNFNSF
jgi:hypothetical protein